MKKSSIPTPHNQGQALSLQESRAVHPASRPSIPRRRPRDPTAAHPTATHALMKAEANSIDPS
jgi:hypothetical protein